MYTCIASPPLNNLEAFERHALVSRSDSAGKPVEPWCFEVVKFPELYRSRFLTLAFDLNNIR